jgi:prefoldin subunit 5
MLTMDENMKEAISQLANSLQMIDDLSTRLRQSLSDSAQHAVDLEGAADRAVRAMKRLQPTTTEDKH